LIAVRERYGVAEVALILDYRQEEVALITGREKYGDAEVAMVTVSEEEEDVIIVLETVRHFGTRSPSKLGARESVR
jgi:hypothetical protein